MKKIPYGRQQIDDEDIRAVVAALKSDFLTTGPRVASFEKSFSERVGAKYAVAVSSGTAALHLACLAAGVGFGDELITSPITFVASANCAIYCGAKPVFADIKSDMSGLIDPSEIKKKITSKTKIVIPVHYGGLPCDLAEISALCKEKKIIIIEDACHALGASYKSSSIGDCAFSDMCVFSLHPVKHITTGEGGIITTNDEQLYNKLLSLRSHGLTRFEKDFLNESHGPWYYEMQDLGFNYRITDFQCALGLSQLKKLGSFVARRQQIAEEYDKFFTKFENSLLFSPFYQDRVSSHHLYVLKMKNKSLRSSLFEKLHEKGIFTQVHYIPVHLQPFYQQKYGYSEGDFPFAEDFYHRILSIPIYPGLSDDEISSVKGELDTFFKS